MNNPRQPNKSNPTTRVAVLIVVLVLIVIGTLFFNAIKGKREYDEQNASASAASTPAVEVTSGATAASAPAASQ
ncbi:MAG: hypothetical protein KGQ57_10875 [Burkholderiales bacterium]|nr:hypothetical protein [Burkholderiales bacterium]